MEKYSFARGIIFLLIILGITSGCHKLDKEHQISFQIKAHIPYNGTPIPGVKYRVREYKSTIFKEEDKYTDWELTGVTDASGIATISFYPKKNTKYQYEITFDYSGIELPVGISDVQLINAPSFDHIPRTGFRELYDIRILPYTTIQYKVENINCFDSNDSMRIILRNIDEYPNTDFTYENWSPYVIGCYNIANQYNGLSGRYVYKIQVIRNGTFNEYFDTILIAPGVNDNLFIEY